MPGEIDLAERSSDLFGCRRRLGASAVGNIDLLGSPLGPNAVCNVDLLGCRRRLGPSAPPISSAATGTSSPAPNADASGRASSTSPALGPSEGARGKSLRDGTGSEREREGKASVTAPDSERKREVPIEFDRAAHRYDLLTGLNPGYHRHLELSAERLALPDRGRGQRVLDLCCGTGLSSEALQKVLPEAHIVGLDASEGMLALARAKPQLRAVELVRGDATDPAAAGARGPFDAILMAYGIRNIAEPDRCLANLRALLRPGAPICFHEYSVRGSIAARAVWEAVALGIIIPGGALSGSGTRIYRYLRRSVHSFDGVRAFEARLARAGFTHVRTEPMDGWQRGIVHSFLARAPLSESGR